MPAKTFDEVAILSNATGQVIQAEARPPEEFLENALAAEADLAYMTCVYTQFKLNVEGAIPDADKTFDNFETITGRQPMTWQTFAERYTNELQQSST